MGAPRVPAELTWYEITAVYECPKCQFIAPILWRFEIASMTGRSGFLAPSCDGGNNHEPRLMRLAGMPHIERVVVPVLQ